MTCPKCNNQISQKSYSPGELIHGEGQLIGKADEPLTVLSCFHCLSFKTFRQSEQHKVAQYLSKVLES